MQNLGDKQRVLNYGIFRSGLCRLSLVWILKRSRVGALSIFHVAVGNLKKGCRLSRFLFKCCRYFLGRVACRNLPWQRLLYTAINLNLFIEPSKDDCLVPMSLKRQKFHFLKSLCVCLMERFSIVIMATGKHQTEITLRFSKNQKGICSILVHSFPLLSLFVCFS